MFTNEYFFTRVSARKGGEGGQPNADSCLQGEWGQKSLKICGHPLSMAPYGKNEDKMKKHGKMSLVFEISISKLGYVAVFMKICKKNFRPIL